VPALVEAATRYALPVRVARLLAATALACSGAAVAVGCSSHSTTSRTTSFGSAAGPSAGGGFGGVSSGALGVAPIENECMSAADCLPGQICCVASLTSAVGSDCQSGPCLAAVQGTGAYQLCATSAECLADGDMCGPVIVPAVANPLGCVPPEAGSPEARSPEAGPVDSATGTFEATAPDAANGADARDGQAPGG
jgi:hypothetical protein